MNQKQDRILRMVESGTISSAEADELRTALEQGRSANSGLERPWEIPFFGGIVVLALGLLTLNRQARRKRPALGACGTMLLGALAIVVGLWSRNAHWLHIRIHERAGKTLGITIPLPLSLADALVRFAAFFMGEREAAPLRAVSAHLEALRQGVPTKPFSIQLDDGDGDQVLIHVG